MNRRRNSGLRNEWLIRQKTDQFNPDRSCQVPHSDCPRMTLLSFKLQKQKPSRSIMRKCSSITSIDGLTEIDRAWPTGDLFVCLPSLRREPRRTGQGKVVWRVIVCDLLWKGQGRRPKDYWSIPGQPSHRSSCRMAGLCGGKPAHGTTLARSRMPGGANWIRRATGELFT